jgi:hypothetical protein
MGGKYSGIYCRTTSCIFAAPYYSINAVARALKAVLFSALPIVAGAKAMFLIRFVAIFFITHAGNNVGAIDNTKPVV